ncbi:putative oxidoreductase [compost metagenome]
MNNETVVLITGCSSGIGRELCTALLEKGYTVCATARNVEDLTDLPASLKLALDVTSEESVSDAINEVISRFHKIDILVNNAGYSIRGALEEIDVNRAKNVFDVNVYGIINLIQAVVPEMRKKQSGRIINIGSISGKFAQPINGAYCASKYAVEALSDALRLELHDFNIQATVIEPGPVRTSFFNTLAANSSDLLSNSDSCYSGFYESDAGHRSKQHLADPKDAAQAIAKIIGIRRLHARYKIAVPYSFRVITRLPDSLKEYVLRKVR